LKVKQDFVEGKTVRFKTQVEFEEEIKTRYESKLQKELEEKEMLKKALQTLEEREFEYINKIKNTVLVKQQELEEFKSNKMNNSMIVINSSAIKKPAQKIAFGSTSSKAKVRPATVTRNSISDRKYQMLNSLKSVKK